MVLFHEAEPVGFVPPFLLKLVLGRTNYVRPRGKGVRNEKGRRSALWFGIQARTGLDMPVGQRR